MEVRDDLILKAIEVVEKLPNSSVYILDRIDAVSKYPQIAHRKSFILGYYVRAIEQEVMK